MLCKSSSNPKAQLYTTGNNKLISHWQKCVDCNGSYFDLKKNAFDPSLN